MQRPTQLWTRRPRHAAAPAGGGPCRPGPARPPAGPGGAAGPRRAARRARAAQRGGAHPPAAGALAVALLLAAAALALAWHALGPRHPAPPAPGSPPSPGAPSGPSTPPAPGTEEPADGDAAPGAPEREREAGPGAGAGTGAGSPAAPRVEVVADGLEVPWDLAFDRQGRLFFTERPGRIGLIDGDRVLRLATLADTAVTGEGGLLGLALHPRFPDEPYLYVYQTYRGAGGVVNRVLRFRFDPGGTGGGAGEGSGTPRLRDRRVIFDGIPGSAIHDGGQLEFGPDGKLYVTTGDAREAGRAQDPRTLHGKILRLNPDGSVPPDNPLGPGNPVYSYGHRNPEGLAFQPGTGALFAVEHGPDAWDELNRIQAGGNYGWPQVTGPGHGPGDRFVPPLRAYNPIIAPAGADFYRGPIAGWDGSLFFGTLGFSPDSAGRHLHRVRLSPDGRRVLEEEVLFKGRFGRIRAVKAGPDGCLYFGTSNRDGRGEPGPRDDRILRACPAGRGG